MQIRATVLLLALAAPAAAAGTAPATDPACQVGPASPCVLTLAGPGAPSLSASCAGAAWSRYLRLRLADGMIDWNDDGSYEAVLELDLDPAGSCRCAVFRITFATALAGWLVDVADSPTSNGSGGDRETTEYCSEAQLKTMIDSPQHASFRVFSKALGSAPQADELLAAEPIEVSGRTVELEVCDQMIELRPGADLPALTLRSKLSQLLFALSGQDRPAFPPRQRPDYKLYAGFNRVVAAQTVDPDTPAADRPAGQPAKGRDGHGVVQVEVFLRP